MVSKMSAAAALLAAAWLAAFPGAAGAAERRNVVIVALDPLRADRLEAYGAPAHLAPEINRFARGAVVFGQAVSPSGWTLPAAMSLFTSLYPHDHGAENLKTQLPGGRRVRTSLPASVDTLPQVFRRAGYRTAAFAGGSPFTRKAGFARGFEVFRGESLSLGGLRGSLRGARAWLESGAGREPFFLFVQGFDMHNVRYVRSRLDGPGGPDWEEALWPRLRRKLQARLMAPPWNFSFDSERARGTMHAVHLKMQARDAGDPDDYPFTPEESAALAGSYDGRLLGPDADFGAFLRYLEDSGLERNTIVVFLSHHGDGVLSHGRLGHGMNLYDELIRVPLLVRAPGARPRREGTQVSLLDLGPALVKAAGLEPGPGYSAQAGGRLLPVFAPAAGCRDEFAETRFRLLMEKSAIRACSGWKLILDSATSERELYDLRADPGEERNLFGREPARAAALERKVVEWMLE